MGRRAWMVAAAWLAVAATAEAKEHKLHPVASGASIPGVLTLTPYEIDVTSPDYVLIVELRNDTDQTMWIPLQGARCLRGGLETLAHGRTPPLVLAPFVAKQVTLRCDHGRWVTGDFGLVLPQVGVDPARDRQHAAQILAEDVTWQLREEDVRRHRQRKEGRRSPACATAGRRRWWRPRRSPRRPSPRPSRRSRPRPRRRRRPRCSRRR
ncbi:MAG: hypothetical protein R3F59_02550 [Myxococcota bacterium]